MKALLLSAGKGTRLHPLTHSVPKCLVPIHGVPLLAYWLESLKNSPEISGVLVNLHHLPEAVENFIKNSPYASFVTFFREETLLGTGGTLLANKDFFADEDVLLIHADNLTHFKTNSFIKAYKDRPSGVEACMMSFVTTAPRSCGIIELDDQGLVQKFHEKVKKPPSNLANAAVYIFSPQIFSILEDKSSKIIDISTEVIPELLGKMNTFHNSGYHRDIGNTDSLLSAQMDYFETYSGDNSLLKSNPLNKPGTSQEWVDAFTLHFKSHKKKLFIFDKYSEDVEAQLVKEASQLSSPKKMFTLFRKVPENFTSYEFYKRTGIASLAFSATG